MHEEKTILVCLGATKSGTTWLYHQLRKHPSCKLRGIKEIHYFDIAEGAKSKKLITKNINALKTVKAKIINGNQSIHLIERQKELRGWLNLVINKKDETCSYVDYLLDGMTPCQKLAADITPSYALLPIERLREMVEMSHDVRFLYLMRDPVSRLWSNIRMAAQNGADKKEDQARLASVLLQKVISGEATPSSKRSDYIGAIKKLLGAIPPERLCIMFYEELMTPAGFSSLCNFCDIPVLLPDFSERVHVGIDLEQTSEQNNLMRIHLQEQYEFVENMFERLPAAWQANVM
ncbi:sulfotransferase [Pseudorhodobacter turbinis]|uniref:sulfotransferase n=1 Tax=Pseudorhodobacter turbinis TaxID=2500533 RepID=UPI00143DC9CD|nr:sulfotransferase [Pseudorhodobacter turbinis]